MLEGNFKFEGMWLKGNLHTHTKNSPCGHYDIEKVIDMYTSYNMEYDFLAITDHYMCTSLAEYINDNKIILFQGAEYKDRDLQSLGINIQYYDDDKFDLDNHQQLFNSVEAQGGFNIICHPHVYNDDYWPLEKLKNLDNYIGLEIFNNNIKHDNKGRAVATDLWDKLLSCGKRVYGFANDDMHVFPRAGGAYNMVFAKNRSRSAILESIKKGSFYCTSGVLIDKIDIQDDVITVAANKLPVEFRFIGKDGQVYHQGTGMEKSYKIKGNEGYIRVELIREDGARAWMQPIFLNRTKYNKVVEVRKTYAKKNKKFS